MKRWARIDLSRLAACHIVAEYGSFRKAAHAMGLSVPAMSTRIKLLEADLGVTLFEREPNRLVPTAVGKRFFAEIKTVFEHLDDALRVIEDFNGCKLGVSLSIGNQLLSFLAPQILRFITENQDVDLSIKISGSRVTREFVENGRVDIGVGYFSGEMPRVVSHRIAHAHIQFICGCGHDLAGRKSLALGDIMRYKIFTVPDHSELRASLSQALEAGRLSAPDLTEVGNCRSAVELAVMSGGVALVHSTCIREVDRSSIQCLDVATPLPDLELAIIHRVDHPAIDRIGALAAMLSGG